MGMTYVLCFGIGLMIAVFVFTLFKMERRRYRELERVLYVDPLTKGFSHQKFMLEAGKKLAAVNPNAAFLVMDIDQFKLVNELFGRQKGCLLYTSAPRFLPSHPPPSHLAGWRSQENHSYPQP